MIYFQISCDKYITGLFKCSNIIIKILKGRVVLCLCHKPVQKYSLLSMIEKY